MMRGCSLLPDDRMVLSCYDTDYVSFINKEGVELFQIGKDKTGSCTFDAVYIKDNNSVAGLAYPFFYQRSTHTALIQQLFRQTFECWWL
jgi:hypothetical protein